MNALTDFSALTLNLTPLANSMSINYLEYSSNRVFLMEHLLSSVKSRPKSAPKPPKRHSLMNLFDLHLSIQLEIGMNVIKLCGQDSMNGVTLAMGSFSFRSFIISEVLLSTVYMLGYSGEAICS